jgi:hypothetical protein
VSGRAALAVFLAASALYLVSPVRDVSDASLALLAAQSLATRGTLDLAPLAARGALEVELPIPRRDGLPYTVRRVGGRVLYDFPLGAVVLAAPWMAVADALGLGVLDRDGRYLPARERAHQAVLAALLAASFAAGAFAAADRLLPRRAALALAAALVLATPLWSTASRALWSHTACLALLGAALPLLARRATGEQAGAFRLGLLAAGAYVARPTAALAGAAIFGAVALGAARGAPGARRALARFVAGAACVALPFVALALGSWGTSLPPYYRGSGLGAPSLEALAGVLVSPNRGLLVFEPALALALACGAARWRALRSRALFAAGAAGVAAHALVVASFGHWWGGHSYGPRLLAESLFFQVAIAVAVAATLAGSGARERAWRRAFGAAVAIGAMIHAGGALSRQGNLWSARPVEVDAAPERVWEWRDWQPLAWLQREPRRARVEADTER